MALRVEILLNPLGVREPNERSVKFWRRNLGWAAAKLGFQAICPVFDGASEENKIRQCLKDAGLPRTARRSL